MIDTTRTVTLETTAEDRDVCVHLDEVHPIAPSAPGCEECLAMGDTWLHLRICMTCGHVGCCDESKNHHATRHHRKSSHPIIRSLQPGEAWEWCYLDEAKLGAA
ncbi:MAG: UBP-type zinc finger domain-containing protein [Gemmatimonadota bacterium]